MGPSVVLNTKEESFFIWKNLKIQRPPPITKKLRRKGKVARGEREEE